MSAPFLDFSAPLPTEAQRSATRSQRDRPVIKAIEALADTARRLGDIASRIGHDDLVMPNGATVDAVLIGLACEAFERRILAVREACADLAGVPDATDVEYADDFRGELKAALVALLEGTRPRDNALDLDPDRALVQAAHERGARLVALTAREEAVA